MLKETRRSASGVRREIGSILLTRSVDYPVAAPLPSAAFARAGPGGRLALPQGNKLSGLLYKIHIVRQGIREVFAAIGTNLNVFTGRVRMCRETAVNSGIICVSGCRGL